MVRDDGTAADARMAGATANTQFRVEVEAGGAVVTVLPGRVRGRYLRIILGERVTVELVRMQPRPRPDHHPGPPAQSVGERPIGRPALRVPPTEDDVMLELRRVEREVRLAGRVDSKHLEDLRHHLYDGGVVSRAAADLLVGLHKRLGHPNPGFEHLFYQVVKDHMLGADRLGAGEAAWLRGVLFADGRLGAGGRKCLCELGGEAGPIGPEFQALYEEAMRVPAG